MYVMSYIFADYIKLCIDFKNMSFLKVKCLVDLIVIWLYGKEFIVLHGILMDDK